MWPSGARTLRAVNAPGMPAWERQRRFRASSGQTLADPVWAAAGEGPAAAVTHSSIAPGIYR